MIKLRNDDAQCCFARPDPNSETAPRFMERHPVLSLQLVSNKLTSSFAGNPLAVEARKLYSKLEDPRFPEQKDGCFVAGTLVWTDKGKVPIEQIKVGDMVLSQPEAGGAQVYKRVKETFVFEDKEIWRVVFMNEEADEFAILVTANHPVWVTKIGWTSVEKLSFGDEVIWQDGTGGCVIKIHPMAGTSVPGVGWLRDKDLGTSEYVDLRQGIINWDNYDDEIRHSYKGFVGGFCFRVYNFEVEDFHTYYVGEYGLWVHNMLCGPQSTTSPPAIYQVSLRDPSRGEAVPSNVPLLLAAEVITAKFPNPSAGGYVIVDKPFRKKRGQV